ncbi:glycoside hydrolase family 16 protein [Mucilaginibacter ginsenosidivorans]|uniref:Glycoside hydrolase family 16 protein n=1 Tax=Mucilaginibacter ginsenosidivorans TaxID=398053 RepID=A0A5B8US52_9SPHI|nr:glycoside hydrolase family 16 protein [Mucilaginibacter ginsenosidivorans]QEC61789.1 glycoside hydrolase family 16 protein [Mucilaginibacter ginsenosidivorans]
MAHINKISLIASMLIAGTMIYGCKKLDGPADTGSIGKTSGSKYTNPTTATATCDYDFNDTDLTNDGWVKTFDEEFDGDLSKWGAVNGGMIKELQLYNPANAHIVSGVLQIDAKKENITGPKTINNDTTKSFNYSSAWIVSRASFAANSSTPKVRIVARIKIASGYGLSSLFYSYGHGAWPTAGELDYMAVQGDNTKVYATDYSYGSTAGVNTVSGGILYNPTTEDLSACYHVYMMEWTENSLNSYLDGKLVESKTKGGYVSQLFGKQQYISLSLPIGGLYYSNINEANIHGGTMYVDYVKVFTSVNK